MSPKPIKHSTSCSWFVMRNHMSGPVNNIKGQPIILSNPTLQAAMRIQHWFFSFNHLPTNLPNILLSLNIGNLSINVSRVQHYFKPCLLEAIKKLDSGHIFFEVSSHIIATGLPFSRFDMQLGLHFWIIEVYSWSGMVRTARLIIIIFSIHFLIKGSIPKSFTHLTLDSINITNTNWVVWVNSLSLLHNIKYTWSTNLFPIVQSKLLSSSVLYLQCEIKDKIYGPKW